MTRLWILIVTLSIVALPMAQALAGPKAGGI
jgi:hypothetical protein